ncbi:MAG TPA: ABC transporter ATP-binding protein [Stellaceae bacterium]
MADPLLDIAGLHAGYGSVEILRGIDLRVDAGEIVALLGANGAGKTTLNNVVSGLLPARRGTIRFAGEDIANLHSRRIVARGLIQVPEGRSIFPTLSVRENLELGSYRRAKPRRAANLDRACAIFPRLRQRWTQLAGTLSGGEQQMLAIGRALMAEPRLLILDEPSLGLSPLLVAEMFALIAKLNDDGCTILLVEQNVVRSLAIADRAYVLENGEIGLAGTAGALLDDAALKRAYLGI